jgi:hypothetical protein
VIARTAPMTAAVLAAAALSLMLADAPAATAGVRIVSPGEEAVVPVGPVPVRLAVRDVRGLRVSVDQGDITGRLRAAGRRRTAVLRGARVRPGAHWLTVRWRTAEGRLARAVTHRYMVARRHRSLAAKLAPRAAVHSTSGLAKLRLRVRRGVGLLRAWVNGRRVPVPHVGRLWPATTLRLGARHRLRFGRNRVRVLVHDFRRARYDVERWTVKVRRTRPLAAGISVYRGKAGGLAVRLDGRGARPTKPGRRLSWRWRIVRRPRGSRARLVGRHWPRPRLRPDVPGRYRLAVTVGEHTVARRRGTRAAQTGPETVYPVTVVADANTLPLGASLEVDLTQASEGGGSITIDDAPSAGLAPQDCTSTTAGTGARRCVYPMRFPEQAVYLLVLDAVTLAPQAPIAQVGRQCPTDDDLRNAIGPWSRSATDPRAGKNVIAILTSAISCGGEATSSLADISDPFTYIFTPTTKPDLGIRSGWYSEAPTFDEAPAEISGYFQKSWPVGSKQFSQQYQFVPGNYVAYDTSKEGAPAGQNTMVVGDREYTSQLPTGATDGFQVLVLDKLLKPMLGTPTTFANGAPVGDMANLLQRARTTPGVSTVLVQSIGRPNPYNVAANDAWNSAAAQLEQLGANTDVFLSLKGRDWQPPEGTSGWYSFVAAPDPGCAPNASLPCESATEASTPLTERDGDISGVLARNQRWQYAPLLDEAGGETGNEIVTLAYQQPQNWPYSDAAARPVLEYLANYEQGSIDLTWLKVAACYDPGPEPDVRSSYCSDRAPWSAIHGDLGNSGTNAGVCANYFDRNTGKPVVPAVTQATYEAICDRISLEALWLDTVHSNMQKVKDQAFGGDQGLTAYMAVADLAAEAKREVETDKAKASHNVAAEALELTGESLELISLFAPEPLGVVGEFFAGTLALAGEVTSLDEGDEQGESAVGDLVTVAPGELGQEMEQRLSAAGLAFDHSWELIVSDPGKLETAYNNFKGPWNGVPEQMDDVKPMIQNGVRHWASGKFMAATYDVWMVDTGQIRGEQARDVGPSDVQTIGCDRHSSWGNTSTWAAFYGVPPEAAYYLRDRLGLTQPKLPDPVPRYGSSIWVFASGNVSDPQAARVWPPASLINNLLTPPQTQGDKPTGGYGWERPWLYSRGQRFNIHGPGWTAQANGCYWFAQDRYPVCSWAPPPCTSRSSAASEMSSRGAAARGTRATRPRR